MPHLTTASSSTGFSLVKHGLDIGKFQFQTIKINRGAILGLFSTCAGTLTWFLGFKSTEKHSHYIK